MKKIVLLFTFIMTSYFGFSQWTTLYSMPNYTLLGVHFYDNNIGYAVGWDFSYGLILRTTDGGTNWVSQSIHHGTYVIELHSVFLFDENNAIVVGGGVSAGGVWDGRIKKTTNAGLNWSDKVAGTSMVYRSVFFVNSDTGYVVGGYHYPNPTSRNSILKTVDAGNSWSGQTCGTTKVLTSVHFPDPNIGFIVGGGGTILRTSNGGANWETLISGTTNDLYSVYFSDINTGYTVGYSGAILKTTNSGLNWANISYGGTLYKVFFTSIDTGYVVGGNGTIRKTTNGGSSWNTQLSAPGYILYSLYFPDANTGYVTGTSGTILKTTNGGVGFFEQNIENESLFITFPNPVSDKITIQLQDAGKTLKGFATLSGFALTICNLQGQVLITQSLTQSNTEIDITGLLAGVYFVKLLVDGVVLKTEKIIKI